MKVYAKTWIKHGIKNIHIVRTSGGLGCLWLKVRGYKYQHTIPEQSASLLNSLNYKQ